MKKTGEQAEQRFSVQYLIRAGSEKEARDKAFDICVEQTIEFPYSLLTEHYIKHTITGNIISLEKAGRNRYLAEISYANIIAGNELTQFLNVVFGNTSLKPGIRVKKIILSEDLLSLFKGPVFGVPGLRNILGVSERPLICTALKPMGLKAGELADLAYRLALGGIDIIKDDHGLTNQEFAPFEERVLLCTKAVQKANRETGVRTLYAPNITADGNTSMERARFAKQAGAGALVISPGLTGFSIVREIAGDPSLHIPLLFHPAFLGSFTASNSSGISHYVLYGQVPRIIGADMTIFPNFRGRFSFSRNACEMIKNACKDEMGNMKSIFPAPGGGMHLSDIGQMKRFYGADVVFLISGGLFASGENLIEACRAFKKSVL